MAGRREFRLEPVLEQRRRLTEEAQQQLAQRAREYQEAIQTLESLHQERSELLRTLDRVQEGAIDVGALASAEAFDLHLRLVADVQERAVMDAEIRENEAREHLVERRVSQKALEKLREKHIAAQTQRLRSAEERMIDEIATIRHALRGATTGGTP